MTDTSQNPLTVYRLVQAGCEMPLHWAYGEPFEVDPERGVVVDARIAGAQVWDSVEAVTRALSGEDMDGTYEAAEYPVVLILQVTQLHWSTANWPHVTPTDVVSAQCASSADVLARVAAWLDVPADEVLFELQDAHDDDEGAVESALKRILRANSRPCTLRWVETLPREDFVPGNLADWPTVTE